MPQSQTGQGIDAVTAYVNTGAQPATEIGYQALQAAPAAYLSAFSVVMFITAGAVLAAGVVSYLLLGGAKNN